MYKDIYIYIYIFLVEKIKSIVAFSLSELVLVSRDVFQ